MVKNDNPSFFFPMSLKPIFLFIIFLFIIKGPFTYYALVTVSQIKQTYYTHTMRRFDNDIYPIYMSIHTQQINTLIHQLDFQQKAEGRRLQQEWIRRSAANYPTLSQLIDSCMEEWHQLMDASLTDRRVLRMKLKETRLRHEHTFSHIPETLVLPSCSPSSPDKLCEQFRNLYSISMKETKLLFKKQTEVLYQKMIYGQHQVVEDRLKSSLYTIWIERPQATLPLWYSGTWYDILLKYTKDFLSGLMNDKQDVLFNITTIL